MRIALKLMNKIIQFMVLQYRKGWVFRPILVKLWNGDKLNLGDTNRQFACWGWDTVDIKNADHRVNFRNGKLPFPSNSSKLIYSSHMIEHISDQSALSLFSEIYRVLKKGGIFRIVCPDLEKAFNAYKNNDYSFFLYHGEFLLKGIRDGALHKDSLLLHNNLIRIFASYTDTGGGPIIDKKTFDQKFNLLNKYDFTKWCSSLLEENTLNDDNAWGHINAFDYPKLEEMLKGVGFSKIKLSKANEFNKKLFPQCCFSENELRKEWISLFVVAIK